MAKEIDIVLDPMPQSEHDGRSIASTLDSVVFNYRKWLDGDPTYTGTSHRWVMGYPLAPWQREFEWTDEQCVKLIENIWRNAPIGSFMINVMERGERHPFDGIIIDGQQRMTAIQKYLDGEFPTKNIHGEDVYWKDVPIVAQRRFRKHSFPSIEIWSEDEKELKEIYNTLNYGGVAHKPEQRAKL